MIYHVYFEGARRDYEIDPWDWNYGAETLIRKLDLITVNPNKFHNSFIKRAKGDVFMFIHTIEQEGEFNKWIEDNGLSDLIRYKSNYLMNANYPTQPPRLKMVVLSHLKECVHEQ